MLVNLAYGSVVVYDTYMDEDYQTVALSGGIVLFGTFGFTVLYICANCNAHVNSPWDGGEEAAEAGSKGSSRYATQDDYDGRRKASNIHARGNRLRTGGGSMRSPHNSQPNTPARRGGSEVMMGFPSSGYGSVKSKQDDNDFYDVFQSPGKVGLIGDVHRISKFKRPPEIDEHHQ